MQTFSKPAPTLCVMEGPSCFFQSEGFCFKEFLTRSCSRGGCSGLSVSALDFGLGDSHKPMRCKGFGPARA